MSDEKRSMLGSSLPIPTYEEATSSRAHSDAGDNPHTNEEASHLLGSSHGRYRQPTVETARSSLESSFLEEFGDSARSSRESLERVMVEMEILEPGEGEEGQQSRGGGGRLRMHISKRISSITDSLSAISIPHHWRINPFRWFSCIRIPDLPCFGEGFVPLYRFIGVIVGLIVVYALLASDSVTLNPPPGAGGGVEFDINALKDYIRDSIEKDNIEHYLEYLSRFDHTAGTEGDFVLAKYIEAKFRSFGLERVGLDEYVIQPSYFESAAKCPNKFAFPEFTDIVFTLISPNPVGESLRSSTHRGKRPLRNQRQMAIMKIHLSSMAIPKLVVPQVP